MTTEAGGRQTAGGVQTGAIIAAAFAGYAKAFRPLLILAVISAAPGVVTQLVLDAGQSAMAWGFEVVLGALITAMTVLAGIVISDAALDGRAVSLGDAFARSGPAFGRMLGWSLVFAAAWVGVALIGVLGFAGVGSGSIPWAVVGALCLVAAVIVALVIMVRWSLFAQIIALEPRGSVGPFARSTQLVRGRFWAVALAWLGLVIFGIPGAALSYAAVDPQTRSIANPAAYWGSVALSIAALPLVTVGAVAVYRGLVGKQGTA